jgi:hypothetical protein
VNAEDKINEWRKPAMEDIRKQIEAEIVGQRGRKIDDRH